MDLIILLKSSYIGFSTNLILLVSVIAVFFGVVIIIAKNPIHSILFLIGLFVTVSIYLILIGLVFIGLSYLLVYVGAISILFLFIVMLINIRVSELITEGKNSLILALLTIVIFTYSISKIIPQSMVSDRTAYVTTNEPTYTQLYNSTIGDLITQQTINDIANINYKYWETILVQISHISAMGNILYTNLFIFLILISLILLLAMVGIIIIIKS